MVAAQSFSISRRTLDVEDYIDIGRRHAGWIVGPAFLGVVASICVAFILPNQYTSRATMQITPAQINENMVQSTISNSLNERIQQMETQILSRGELSAIIQDPRNNLYKDELKAKPLEDVIADMRGAIHIDFVALPGALGRRASAFNIEFSYNDRYKARATVEALMNKFTELNQNTQKTDQDAVTGLVTDLMNHAKADLQDAQDKLTAFKEGNAGKLPEQASVNIARLNGYTEKIRSTREQSYRDQQAIDDLTAQANQENARLDFYNENQVAMATLKSAPGNPANQQNQELAKLDQYIENAEFSIQQMHRQYSDKYLPLKTAQIQLQGYREKRDQLAKTVQAKAEADAAKAAADAAKPKEVVTDPQEKQIRFSVAQRLQNIDLAKKRLLTEIEKLKTEEAGYAAESEEINQMLKASTGIEAQYEELNHAKQLAEEAYIDYEKKSQVADANKQLIERKAGEVLDVLDTASTPVQPTSPHRLQIIGAGIGMSIILGLGMAGLQEAKDTSLKNLKDVRAYTNLPVLCSIPLLENTMLVKRKRRLTYLAWAAAVLVGAACVSGAVVYYYTVTVKS